MVRYRVENGSLSLEVEKDIPRHAALEAIRYWYSTNAVVFSRITDVIDPSDSEEPMMFETTLLMNQLGIDWNEHDDEDDNRIYKPRLCTDTARPISQHVQHGFRQGWKTGGVESGVPS